MTKLTQDRINFIEQLHGVFYLKKGYGAFAFISVSDAMSLYEKYLGSSEPVDIFIKRFVHSIE